MRWLPVLCFLFGTYSSAIAQTTYPTLDPAKELKGPSLVAQLRQGGFVLYLRHATNGPPTEQCKPQSGLTPLGEEQSRTVGAALRALRIPVASVWSSQTCRTEQTARLLGVGNVDTTIDLNPGGGDVMAERDAARARRLLETPPLGYNTVLVSHVQSARLPHDQMQLALAEVIVFRAGSQERPEPVARVRLQDWPSLLQTAPD